MDLVRLSEVFDVKNGHGLELNSQETCPEKEHAFISRTSNNNGVVECIKKPKNIEPFPKGLMTCAVSGNGVRSTFI